MGDLGRDIAIFPHRDYNHTTMTSPYLPLGKLPPHLLQQVIGAGAKKDARVVLGPGIGLDCAVVQPGDALLVYKSDPITFATQDIGWYAVQVNANDVATTGALPRWFLVTALLPEAHTTPELIQEISAQVQQACAALGVTIIGGHTEITQGLERPILIGTMIGEVGREKLVTPQGARPGDKLMLTKGVPLEAAAILAREFADRLPSTFSAEEIQTAQNYLYQPGISIIRDARLALSAGRVTAMHDPTEGGLAAALWELALASGRSLVVDCAAVPVPDLAQRLCAAFGLEALCAIASGALLFSVHPADGRAVQTALESEGIPCAEIGEVEETPSGAQPEVWQIREGDLERMPYPARDEIARLFEETQP